MYSTIARAGDGSSDLSAANNPFADGGMGAVPQRDADLLHLYTAYQRAAGPVAKAAALAVLDAEIDRRRATDNSIRSAVWDLLQQPAVLAQLQVCNTGLRPPSCLLCIKCVMHGCNILW